MTNWADHMAIDRPRLIIYIKYMANKRGGKDPERRFQTKEIQELGSHVVSNSHH